MTCQVQLLRVVPQCGLPPLGWPAAPLSAHLPSTPSTFSPRLFLSIRFATLIYVPNAAVGRGWRDHRLACEPSRATRSLAPTGPSLPLSSRFLPKIPSKFRRNSSLSRAQAPFEFRDREPIRSESGDLARFDETTIVRRNVRGRGEREEMAGYFPRLLPCRAVVTSRIRGRREGTAISSSVPLQISREGIGETGRGERRL